MGHCWKGCIALLQNIFNMSHITPSRRKEERLKSTNEKSLFVRSLLMQDSNRGGMSGIYFCSHFRPNHQESNQTIDDWDGRNKICAFSVPGIQSLLLQLHLSTNLRDWLQKSYNKISTSWNCINLRQTLRYVRKKVLSASARNIHRKCRSPLNLITYYNPFHITPEISQISSVDL